MNKILMRLDHRSLEILDIIYTKGPITKKYIQSITNTKLTTLNREMKVLADEKLISEFGEEESTGGRKAIKYDMALAGFYTIGIDISRTYVKLILTNMKLNILIKKDFILDESYSPEKTIELIVSIIEQMLRDSAITRNQILGVGIGTVGPIDREKGIILNPKGFFNKNWINVPLKSLIEEKLSIPCFIENGANNAVLAEYLFGKRKEVKSVAYIHCGIGLRSAIIKDGIIIRTMNDREDAFGHMIIEPNGEKCICGNHGCIECYSSLDSIVKRINARTKLNKDDINEINYKEILRTELQNNEIVMEVINKGAEILGIGITNLVRLLNPDIVILSGPLIMNFKNYYERCIETFYENNPNADSIIFSKGGRFQEDTIAIGSAAMVMEFYLKHLKNDN
jgi:predicted NBD/HSP70 family sugar kinase